MSFLALDIFDLPLICIDCVRALYVVPVHFYDYNLIQYLLMCNTVFFLQAAPSGLLTAGCSQRAAHKRIHLERFYACANCGKKFTHSHQLKRHEVVHTGAKEFKCPMCAYMCNVKSNLKKHCNAVHQMDYPTPDVKRVKIMPQAEGISNTVAIDNAAVNSGTVAIGNSAVNSGTVAIGSTAVNLGTVAIGSTPVNLGTVAIGSTAVNLGTVAIGSTAVNSGTVAIGSTAVNLGTVAIGSTAVNL